MMLPNALLLLGPTGSGKTPLGQMLAQRGLAGRRCVHFDFGEDMRRAVARAQPDAILAREDLRLLREVLSSGALLEDKDFPIADRLLRSFLTRQNVNHTTLVVLNGLPRHLGQAKGIETTVDVRTVVHLNCSPDTVLARIAANTGGDRTTRTDDDLTAVQRKLGIFTRRTAPLVEHYRRRGAAMVTIDVAPEMTAEEMLCDIAEVYDRIATSTRPRRTRRENL
jgi:adenylate kinase family enzyme